MPSISPVPSRSRMSTSSWPSGTDGSMLAHWPLASKSFPRHSPIDPRPLSKVGCGDELLSLLRQKLVEETLELHATEGRDDVAEAADVIESFGRSPWPWVSPSTTWWQRPMANGAGEAASKKAWFSRAMRSSGSSACLSTPPPSGGMKRRSHCPLTETASSCTSARPGRHPLDAGGRARRAGFCPAVAVRRLVRAISSGGAGRCDPRDPGRRQVLEVLRSRGPCTVEVRSP